MRSLASPVRLGQRKWVRMGLFPLLLLIFTLIGTGRGLDLSDTTYSLGNYRFLNVLEGDWIYATGLANLFGHILLGVGGGSMMGMLILCRLLICATALIAYFALADEKNALPVFIGSWIAIGFCWCPAVILYNYLSYFLLTAAALKLRQANESGDLKQDAQAGVLLGISLFVRISDLVYCALILYVWISCILRDGKITKRLLRRTLSCLFSYIAGAVAGILILTAGRSTSASGLGGIGGMVSWIVSLASSDGEAGGYSLGTMLLTVLKAYLWAAQRLLPLLLTAGFGVLLWGILKADKWKVFRYGGLLAAVSVLFVFYCRRGVFTLLYHSNGSVYGIGAVLLLILALIFFAVLTGGHRHTVQEREAAVLGLLLLFIAPLGTNNHLYAVLNQLFLILPLALSLLPALRERLGRAAAEPLQVTLTAFVLLLFVQTSLFHAVYSFSDGEDGQKLDEIMTEPVKLMGIRTGRERAAAVLSVARNPQIGAADTLLTYGNIPGMHYVTDLPPAISTLWPDLESYPAEAFRQELAKVGDKLPYPVVILSSEAAERIALRENGEGTESLRQKDGDVKDFLDRNGYEIKYEDAEFILYAR